jgi:hypothetical protein
VFWNKSILAMVPLWRLLSSLYYVYLRLLSRCDDNISRISCWALAFRGDSLCGSGNFSEPDNLLITLHLHCLWRNNINIEHSPFLYIHSSWISTSFEIQFNDRSILMGYEQSIYLFCSVIYDNIHRGIQ